VGALGDADSSCASAAGTNGAAAGGPLVGAAAPVTLCGTSVGVAGTASSSCTPGVGTAADGGPSILGVDLADLFLPITACGNAVGALGDATTACDAVAATDLATPTNPAAPGTPTTFVAGNGGNGGPAGGTGGARGLVSSAGGAVDTLAGSSDGSDLPTTGLAIGGTLVLAAALAVLGTFGRLAGHRRTAQRSVAAIGHDG
jgi:hypothetical protein